MRPGGRGPSLPTSNGAISTPWFDALGPVLSVHDSHGYSNFDRFVPTYRVLPTATVLHGRPSVGLFFSADWCPPCAAFTPLLSALYKKLQPRDSSDSPFEVVLVSRCKTKEDTEKYFSTMPWTAMAHLDSMGQRGQDLMTKFGVATIPALVLLDGLGTVVCGDGRRRLVNDPTGVHFPWTDSLSLPPDPRLGPHRAPPTGHTHPVSPLPHRTSWAPVPRRLRYHDGEINQPPHPSQLSHKEKARSLSPSPMGWIERMQPPENEKRPSGSRRRPRIGLRLPSWH